MTARILFVVDNLPRASFFARFAASCVRSNVTFRYLSYRVSSHRYLRRMGLDSQLLRRTRSETRCLPANLENACAKSQEVIRGEVKLARATKMAASIAGAVQGALDEFRPTHVCVWNGAQLVERVATSLANDDVKRRFFEIANVPGRLFIDSKGVNAAASLYKAPLTLLDRGVPSDEAYERWRREYLEQFSGNVPQAKAAHAMQWERPFDAFASRIGVGFYPIEWRRMVKRFKGKLTHSAGVQDLIEKYRFHPEDNRPFRFFPLQVSDDTQLLLNSDLGNIEALQAVSSECHQDRTDLVIKIHPAENNRAALNELRDTLQTLRRSGRIFVTDLPTHTLIQRAEKVYTINSTVGLETLICDRPIEFLGRSFFPAFVNRPDLLKSYLLNYLVSMDYFGTADADLTVLQRVLEGWGRQDDANPLVDDCSLAESL